jgi:large subunit ribosomal protein L3
MIQALIGQKSEQTQKFLQNGRRIPVTKIIISDNAILQVKTATTDSYAAVQLGFGAKKKVTKPIAGHVKKAGFSVIPQTIREVALTDATEEELPKVGDVIAVDAVFKAGDIVAVTGTSKGKGFAGVVKRHGFRGGPKTHGQSDRERAPGSIGQTTTPGRVYKGKRMAGRMGHETSTVLNLTIVDVDAENKILSVCGLVPGAKKGFLMVTKTGEDKDFVPLLQEEKEIAVESQTEEPEVVAEAVAQEEIVAEEKVETKEGGKEDGK